MNSVLAAMPAIVSEHLSLAIFFFLLLFGFTLSIPEEIALVMVGVTVKAGGAPFQAALGAAILALLFADSAFYAIARLVGPRLLRIKRLAFLIKPEKVMQGEGYFRHRGPRIVFLSRFVVGLRTPAILGAGIFRMPWPRFAAYDGLAVLITTPAWLAVGFALGAQFDKEVGGLGKVLALLGPLAAIAGSFLIYRNIKANKGDSESA